MVDRVAGGRNFVGSPAVAAGAHVFLVAWRNGASLLARRYDFDGRAVDPQPLLLDGAYGGNVIPSIGFDGSAFLVVWDHQRSLLAGTIGETGALSSERAIPSIPDPAIEGINGSSQCARVLWTGREFVVPYTVGTFPAPVLFFISRFIALARVDVAASILSQPSLIGFNDAGINSLKLAATFANGRVTYAWTDRNNDLSVAQTAPDGTVLRPPRVVVPHLLDVDGPQIVWNGAEYVLLWSASDLADRKTNVMRLDAELKPIDAALIDVPINNARDLSLIATGTGVTIGYSRFDDATGTWRAFTRTLDRALPLPRERAIRR
jgi:hypothetical protein